jgi:hypothetical protein
MDSRPHLNRDSGLSALKRTALNFVSKGIRWASGRPAIGILVLLVATIFYLVALQSSQELSGTGSVLVSGQPVAKGDQTRGTAFFPLRKSERYVVWMQGQISSPVLLELRDSSGQALSSTRLMRPVPGQTGARYWKTLKARTSCDEAQVTLKMEDGSAADFTDVSVRQLDGTSEGRRVAATLSYGFLLAAFCVIHRRRRIAQALALGSAYFLFLTPWNLPGEFAFSADNRFYVPTGMSLLERGDLDINEFGGAEPAAPFGSDYRVMRGSGDHYFNTYPVGTSLVVLPMIVIGNFIYDEIPDSFERARLIAIFAARLLSAATVAGVYLLITLLSGRPRLGIGIALVFAFATPHLGIHGGGLWSHTSTTFLSTIALGLMVWRSGRYAGWSALPLCLGFACRPTIAFPGLILGLGLLMRDRRQFALFAALSLVMGLAFVGLSESMWGRVLPPYYTNHASLQRNGYTAFVGTLVSPNRGLLIYSPIFIFALLGGVVAWRQKIPEFFFHRLCTLIVIVEWVLASRNLQWWGGHSYGPRIMSEALVFAVPLLVPAWDWVVRRGRRMRLVLFSVAFASCIWGVMVEWRALVSTDVYFWNARPDVDQNPDRLWSWKDWQIFAKPY